MQAGLGVEIHRNWQIQASYTSAHRRIFETRAI